MVPGGPAANRRAGPWTPDSPPPDHAHTDTFPPVPPPPTLTPHPSRTPRTRAATPDRKAGPASPRRESRDNQKCLRWAGSRTSTLPSCARARLPFPITSTNTTPTQDPANRFGARSTRTTRTFPRPLGLSHSPRRSASRPTPAPRRPSPARFEATATLPPGLFSCREREYSTPVPGRKSGGIWRESAAMGSGRARRVFPPGTTARCTSNPEDTRGRWSQRERRASMTSWMARRSEVWSRVSSVSSQIITPLACSRASAVLRLMVAMPL